MNRGPPQFFGSVSKKHVVSRKLSLPEPASEGLGLAGTDPRRCLESAEIRRSDRQGLTNCSGEAHRAVFIAFKPFPFFIGDLSTLSTSKVYDGARVGEIIDLPSRHSVAE